MSFGIRNVPDRTKVGGLVDADRGVGDVGIQEVQLCFSIFFQELWRFRSSISSGCFFCPNLFGGVGFAKNHPIFTLRGRWMVFLGDSDQISWVFPRG